MIIEIWGYSITSWNQKEKQRVMASAQLPTHGSMMDGCNTVVLIRSETNHVLRTS